MMASFGSSRAGVFIDPAHGTRGSNRTVKQDEKPEKKDAPKKPAKKDVASEPKPTV